MKRSIVIIFIQLISTIAAFSQEMQLTVSNKPLNTVLGMLGMEISFDDKALSAYNISVSKTFKNPEDALYHLLNNKPFKVEKIIRKQSHPNLTDNLFSPEPHPARKPKIH